MNIVNFLPQRDSAGRAIRVQRATSDKWDFHMYHARRLLLQLPRFSKKQSECEELVRAKLNNESNYSSFSFSSTSSVYRFILTCLVLGLLLWVSAQQFVALCAPDPGFLSPSHPGVSEADEGQRRTRGTLRHVRGLPGHLRLGALGAAGG